MSHHTWEKAVCEHKHISADVEWGWVFIFSSNGYRGHRLQTRLYDKHYWEEWKIPGLKELKIEEEMDPCKWIIIKKKNMESVVGILRTKWLSLGRWIRDHWHWGQALKEDWANQRRTGCAGSCDASTEQRCMSESIGPPLTLGGPQARVRMEVPPYLICLDN